MNEPQITAARTALWHQAGEALLTLEAARTWLDASGLLLFAPRGGTLGAPAPSLVEATLGEARATVAAAESITARTLVARMVGEGSAVPLNLLGGPGDLPDFVVSAQAFPFVFTLRGDKGWKRAPETSGAVKVTPLGLRVYELLSERGAMTVGEIVPEIGREITESAVTRSLGELWHMLRVIPVLQQGEGDTRWELTTARFLKAVKAGANAGQPTALSALIAAYLGQALVATEEEISGFLSPLAARSRVREVVHGLGAGRQLSEGVIAGKTVLYVPDSLADLASYGPQAEAPATEELDGASEEEGAGAIEDASMPQAEGEASGEERPRIRRFEGAEGGPARGLRGKPFGRPEGGSAPERRGPRPTGDRPERAGFSRGPRREDGGQRPFGGRPPRPGFSRPSAGGAGDAPRRFDRPWSEERRDRPASSGDREGGRGSFRPRTEGGEGRPFRPRREEGGDRPFRPRFEGGDRPQRPFRPREEGGDRPFRPRPEGDRPPRPFRPREGGGDRPFRPRPEGDRPPRPFRPREEGGDRPFRPRFEGGDRPQRPFRPREEGGDRPFRPRPEGDRPFRGRSEGGDRPFRPRPEGDRPPRPFRPRPEGGGDRPFRPRPEGGGDRPFRPREGGGDRPFRPRPEGDRPPRPFRPREEGGDRPFRPRPEGGGFGAGRPRREGSGGGFSRPGGPGGRPSREGGSFRPRPGGDGPRGPRPAGGGFGRPGGKPFGGPKRTDGPRPPRRPEDEA